jgi:hypothetical protein
MQTIAALEYRNQAIFPWETFSNRVAKAYGRLEKNGVVFPLWEQLRTVSQEIRTTNITFNTLAKPALTYQPAGNHDLKWYLSQVGTHVANEFPLAAVNRGNFQRNVSAFEAGGGNGTTNVDYVIEDVGDRQYCNRVDVTDHLRKYNPDEWSRLPYELKGEIYRRKRERGGAGGRGRGRGRGRGSSGSSVASLTSQIQAMQASIAALATGADDMSTLTDPPVPIAQTPPSPTDQSTTSELGK